MTVNQIMAVMICKLALVLLFFTVQEGGAAFPYV